MKRLRLIRQFATDRRGGVAYAFAASVVPLLLTVGAGIDYSRAHSAKAYMQSAVDGAALAVTAASQTSTNKTVLEGVASNYVKAQDWSQHLTSWTDPTLNISPDNRYTVNFSGKVETAFMKIVGISSVDVRVSAEATRATMGINEIALVLDTTGSMSGTKIDTLKSAAKSMVQSVFTGGAQDVSFAVVPFSTHVNIGVSRRNESWIDVPADYSQTVKQCFLWWCNNVTTNYTFSGCVGSRPSPYTTRISDTGVSRYPGLMNTTCTTEILPLTKVQGQVISAINALPASGNTYIPAGLTWGWNVLSPIAPFTEAKAFDPNNNKPRKVLVLMTDGANTISPVFPSGAHTGSDVATANSLTSQLCTAIKADKIEIFTVAFEVTDPATITMLQNCASKTANAYNASDSAALTAAFSAIGDSLSGARLTK